MQVVDGEGFSNGLEEDCYKNIEVEEGEFFEFAAFVQPFPYLFFINHDQYYNRIIISWGV